LGIVRHVPNDLTPDNVKSLVPNCGEAKQNGSTRSFGLKVETKYDLLRVIKFPLVIGFEGFPIQEFLFYPFDAINSKYGRNLLFRPWRKGHRSSKTVPC